VSQPFSVLLSHPFGNANVRHAALAFAESGQLAGFRTCIHWPEKSPLAPFLPHAIRQQLQRRSFPPAVARLAAARPLREIIRLLALQLGWKSLTAHEIGWASVDAVSRDLDAAVAHEIATTPHPPAAIYAYEDTAAASFRAARERNISCIYDLPIGYWREARRIQSEEAILQPEWAATLTATLDSPRKLNQKEDELDLADLIIVASRFTASTLASRPQLFAPVHIIPYGCPPPAAAPGATPDGPLRVLFVGSLGQRKGTSYLLDAIDQIQPHATLTLIGSRPHAPCPPLDIALKKHRWLPSLPHDEVLREMREHDVLVFPSLFEGFGLVLLEALSQGIPVITTPHTGGPDILTEGEDGYIVPIRDSAAIAEKLTLLIRDRRHLQEMKASALRKAAQLTWQKYRSDLLSAGSPLFA